MVRIVQYSTEAQNTLIKHSLEDPFDTSLEIFGWKRKHESGGFSIPSSLAQSIREKLLSGPTVGRHPWTMLIGGAVGNYGGLQSQEHRVAKLVGCFPEDDEALHILQSAFKQVKMKKLVIHGIDSSNQQHKLML